MQGTIFHFSVFLYILNVLFLETNVLDSKFLPLSMVLAVFEKMVSKTRKIKERVIKNN